jgi:hypothetical protein
LIFPGPEKIQPLFDSVGVYGVIFPYFLTSLLPYFLTSLHEDGIVLSKMTSKNQITLPKVILSKVPSVEYFDVEVEEGRIVLTPVTVQKVHAVREKLAELGISEKDVADAVNWARGKE